MGGQFKKIYKEDIDRCITAIKNPKILRNSISYFRGTQKGYYIFICKMYALDKRWINYCRYLLKMD